MAILEVGIYFRDILLVNSIFLKKNLRDSKEFKHFKNYREKRDVLIPSILELREDAFLTDIIDYLIKDDYVIGFFEDTIVSDEKNEPELLLSYGIAHNKRNINRYVYKVMIPILRIISSKFKARYISIKLSKLSKYKKFKSEINEILGDEVKSTDQKFKDALF